MEEIGLLVRVVVSGRIEMNGFVKDSRNPDTRFKVDGSSQITVSVLRRFVKNNVRLVPSTLRRLRLKFIINRLGKVRVLVSFSPGSELNPYFDGVYLNTSIMIFSSNNTTISDIMTSLG